MKTEGLELQGGKKSKGVSETEVSVVDHPSREFLKLYGMADTKLVTV